MRKIERDMLVSIRAGKNWSKGNTVVAVVGGYSYIYLHGNHIATVSPKGSVRVNTSTLCDWPTPTTCSRLRALGADVRVSKGIPLLDGEPV